MDANTQRLMMGAAGVSGTTATYVEDVFNTWLYTGNGSTQTIINGIDLSGQNGLVWIKQRNDAKGHRFVDTVRGATKSLSSSSTSPSAAEVTESTGLTSFSSSGFSLGANTDYNTNAQIYASWTFRKTGKFFDVVTYTGTGANRTIAHSLGSIPGCIIVKRTDTTGDWQVYHRSLANTEYLVLNTTAAKATGATRWNSTSPTSTVFSLGTDVSVNATGGAYIAYLFANEAGGFGDGGADSVVACGSYTGNGFAAGPTVSLSWEPQWLLIKRTDATGDWQLIDNMRGFASSGADAELNPNLNNTESSGTFVTPLSTGFQINTTDVGYNAQGNYIYVAIRRGPMKTPVNATLFFQPKLYTGTNVDNRFVTTDIVTDMAWVRQRNSTTVAGMVVGDRLRGQPYSLTNSTAIEVNDANSFDQEIFSAVEYGTAFSSMTGFWVGADATSSMNVNTTSNNHLAYAFRRAPGYFDMVAYTGDGVLGRSITHNLGAKPLINIIKRRDVGTGSWTIYTDLIDGSLDFLQFDQTAKQDSSLGGLVPTSTLFYVSNGSNVNANGSNFIAYLFGNVTGVSKCGVYTGTGATLNIDCGFTAGARFVLIKRTDSTGDWYVWDTARGIIAANDPYLSPNSTAAEVTNTDYIDPLNAGFQISSTAPANINGSGGTFLYLAIA